MKREPEWFEEREVALVYIAARLGDATRLEGVLGDAGIDFAVEADEYEGGFIFRRVRTGAFFYVESADAEAARAVMRRNGYRPLKAED